MDNISTAAETSAQLQIQAIDLLSTNLTAIL